MAGFGIYQAEPPGHSVEGRGLDMLYELLELGRVSGSSRKAGRGKRDPPGVEKSMLVFETKIDVSGKACLFDNRGDLRVPSTGVAVHHCY